MPGVAFGKEVNSKTVQGVDVATGWQEVKRRQRGLSR